MLEKAPEALSRRSPPLVVNWGLIDYAQALEKQLSLVERVQEDPSQETIVTCRHPPVVTLGRSTKPEDLFDWTGATFEVQRGGRATYHGPSQLVIYPILDLNSRGRDLSKYLRNLETALIKTLADFGIVSKAEEGATGVWVGPQKIASIGIGVKKWVSYHGIALNVSHDPEAFKGINPCGFSSDVMTSMDAQVHRANEFDSVTERLILHLSEILSK